MNGPFRGPPRPPGFRPPGAAGTTSGPGGPPRPPGATGQTGTGPRPPGVGGPLRPPGALSGPPSGERKPFPPRGGGGDFRKKEKDGLRVNREIRAQQVRVIDEEGQQLGVMSPFDGIRLAEERGLDLIEIAPTASPPTCKIMDYGKWKYENKKKQAAARKKQIIIQVKEIQIRPRTDQHDMETKVKHARRFLIEGDKVKVNLRFSGREMAHQELGLAVLKKVIELLKDIAAPEVPPKTEGRQMFVLLAPDANLVKDYLKAHPEFAPKTDHQKDDDGAKTSAKKAGDGEAENNDEDDTAE